MCWRAAGRGARRYLKSSRSTRGDQDSRRPTPPPPCECRELWSLWDASSEVAQGPARHAGAASPSGAPRDFRFWHPWLTPGDSAFPGAPAAGHEDGGGGYTPLKQRRWNLPRRRGRSGSLTPTGKSPGGRRLAPAFTRPSAPDHPASRPRLPGDGFLLLALLLYAPIGFCLLILRLFLGIHVFLVSCALPDSVLRRFRPGHSGRVKTGSGRRPCSHHCLRPQVRGTDHVCGTGARDPARGLRTPGSARQSPHFQPRDTFRPQHCQPAHQL